MTLPAHTDVLIVGAGPTGLMLGVQLARRGVRALIVDKNPGPSVYSKALGVHARSLEIYSHLGIADRALELGIRAAAANLWVEGRRAARVPLGDIGRDLSPYPFMLILAQDRNEQLLGEVLRGLGVEVSWNTELVELEQRAGSASAMLRRADGTTQEIEAKWVAGCDGPHSAVRDLCGIDFPGAPYEHVFYVADTTATGPMAPSELNVYLLRKGFLCSSRCAGRTTGGSSGPSRGTCAEGTIWNSRPWPRQSADRWALPLCFRNAAGFQPTTSIIAVPNGFGTAGVSCSAMLRTFTAPWAAKA